MDSICLKKYRWLDSVLSVHRIIQLDPEVFDFFDLIIHPFTEILDIVCSGIHFTNNLFPVPLNLTELIVGVLKVLLSDVEIVVEPLDVRLSFVFLLKG